MKRYTALLTLAVALLAAACTSLTTNQAQVNILGKPDDRGHYANVTAKDRATVKEVLSNFATQWRLDDRTSMSFIPTAVAAFSQDWNVTQYPLTLTAWEQEGKIIVDMTQKSPSVGEGLIFRERKAVLITALQEKFPNRAILPKLSEYIHRLPVGVPVQEKK
jgi:hypothetical protein